MSTAPPDADAIRAHIEARYGISVTAAAQLDQGTVKLALEDGRSWIARAFGSLRPVPVVRDDAAILRRLEFAGFPAERLAHLEPVSVLGECAVLVTGAVPGGPADGGRRTQAFLGGLLGALHARDPDDLPPGGAWHHLATGTPADEVRAASAMLDDALADVGVRELAAFDRLRDVVEQTDPCEDLPHCFVHPDFVAANAIATPDDRRVIVDWAGAGRGPRVWSLGFMLWAAGERGIPVAAARYRRRVSLEPEEIDRLQGAIAARAVMLEIWAHCVRRRSVAETTLRVERIGDRAAQLGAIARRELTARGG